MPAGLVEDKHGMGVRCDHGADLGEMRLHRLRVAERHDEPSALAFGRADRPEQVGPGGALVVRRSRPGSAPRPPAGELVLLADARLVLPPELYALARMLVGDRSQALGKTLWNGPPLRRRIA